MPSQPFPTREWQAADRTGGPLDDVLDELRRQHPDLRAERLGKTHPSDDDNVYFLGVANLQNIVQVDTGPDGQPPFTIEADDRIDTSESAEALAAIQAVLSATR